MITEQAETDYKGITIIHLFANYGFVVKDILKKTVVKSTGIMVHEYRRLYGDSFREKKRNENINHRFSKLFTTLNDAKFAIDNYLKQ